MEKSTAPSFSSSFECDVDEETKEHKQSTTYFNGPRSQGSMYSYFGIPRSRKEHIAKVRFWPLSRIRSDCNAHVLADAFSQRGMVIELLS